MLLDENNNFLEKGAKIRQVEYLQHDMPQSAIQG